jgi:hypothetical protein
MTSPHEYGIYHPQTPEIYTAQPASAVPFLPPSDPILDSPEYKRAFAHYTMQGAIAERAHAEAYWWAAQQLAATPPVPMQQQPMMAPPVFINNNVAATAMVAGYAGRRRTNHALHFVLTLFTGGLWAPVWFFVWLGNR